MSQVRALILSAVLTATVGAAVAKTNAVPPATQIAAALDARAKLIPLGDYVALALDVDNGNPRSAVLFAESNVELIDRQGVAHTTDPLHPLLVLRMQRALFEASNGTYYQDLHTTDNVIHAGNPDHFVGIFKKGDYVSGRIAVRYYVPDYDAQPTVTKTFSIK